MRCHLKPAEVERIIAIAGGCSSHESLIGLRSLSCPQHSLEPPGCCSTWLNSPKQLSTPTHSSFASLPLAEPYTQSVRKRASRMSMAAGDFVLRSVGGKAHAR